RRAVAVKAPLHVQRRVLPCQRHFIHRPVTGGAADALLDVDAVIEVDEICQVVNAVPANRLTGAVTFAYRFEQRATVPDLRVAVHARLGWRQTGELRVLDRCVAVATINPQTADMMAMAERHRLFAGDVDAGGV